MHLYPIVRFSRAVSAALILHNDYLNGIAISEIGSVVLPFINISSIFEYIAYISAIMYAPQFSSAIIDKYVSNIENRNLVYLQAEICTIMFFIFFMVIDKF